MTSWQGNDFHITGPLWEESAGYRWIPSKGTVIIRFVVRGEPENAIFGDWRYHGADMTSLYFPGVLIHTYQFARI